MTNRADNRAYWDQKVKNNPLHNMMEVMNEVCDGIATSRIKGSYVFVGPPGCGKTSGFERSMRRNNARYEKIDCASAEAFALSLHECAARGKIALVDDQNGMWRTPAGLQWLMKATLPNGSRKFTLRYADTRKNKELDFTGLVIVILTNKPREKWGEDNGELGALDDRMSIIEMMATRQELFDFTCHLAICGEFLKPHGYPLDIANKTLNFFGTHPNEFRTISPRTLEDIAVNMVATPQTWEKQARAKFVQKKPTKRDLIEVPVMPQIIPAVPKPKPEKLAPLEIEPTFFCDFDDANPDTATARAKAREQIIELHGKGWRNPADIIEHVGHYAFVKVTEDDIAAIVGTTATAQDVQTTTSDEVCDFAPGLAPTPDEISDDLKPTKATRSKKARKLEADPATNAKASRPAKRAPRAIQWGRKFDDRQRAAIYLQMRRERAAKFSVEVISENARAAYDANIPPGLVVRVLSEDPSMWDGEFAKWVRKLEKAA